MQSKWVIGIIVGMVSFSAAAQVQLALPKPAQQSKNLVPTNIPASKTTGMDGSVNKKMFLANAEAFFSNNALQNDEVAKKEFLANTEKFYNAMDKNHDGVISQDELYGAYSEANAKPKVGR